MPGKDSKKRISGQLSRLSRVFDLFCTFVRFSTSFERTKHI